MRHARTITTSLVAVLLLCPKGGHAETWTETRAAVGISLNAVTFLSATEVVAVGDNYTILLSADGGASWSDVAPAGPVDHLNAVAFDGVTVVAVGDNGRIVVSDNRGASGSWNERGGQTDKILYGVAVSGATIVAVGEKTGGGARKYTVIQSTNGGTSFTKRPDGSFPANNAKNLTAVAFVSAPHVIAVGDKAQGVGYTILRSADGGADWTAGVTQNGGPPNKNLNVVVANGNTVVAGGDKIDADYAAIYYSTDGGQNWELPTTLPGDSKAINDITFVSPSTLLAVGDRKNPGFGFRIFRSTDFGDKWFEMSVLAPGAEHLAAVAATSSLALAVGASGAILASDNGGTTWTADDIQGPFASDLLDVGTINPSIVVGSGGEVLLRGSPGGSGSSGGFGADGVLVLGTEPVAIPFGLQWLFAVAVLASAMYWLRQ